MTSSPSHAIDAGAAGIMISSILGWLPPTAAALSIAWYLYLFFKEYRKNRGK